MSNVNVKTRLLIQLMTLQFFFDVAVLSNLNFKNCYQNPSGLYKKDAGLN